MFSVILVILKVIGIIIAAVLGLFILLLALILFVPIRYKARISKNSELNSNACISWLLHIINISIIYSPDGSWLIVRVFGIPFIKKPSDKGNKKNKRKSIKTESIKTESVNEFREQSEDPINASGQEQNSNTDNNEEAERRKDTKKKTLLQKITEKILSLINKVVQTVKRIYNKLCGFKKIIDGIKDFWNDPVNKLAVSFCKTNIIKVLKHIMPIKAKGYVVFGTGDPYNTGRILALLGMFYGRYGESIRITPEFNEAVFEAELMVKGRIRLFTLGIICLKVIMNKDVRYLKAAATKLMEEAKEAAAA